MNAILKQIGVVRAGEDGFFVEIAPEFRPALRGLDNFEYAQIIWWADRCDVPQARSQTTERKPYAAGPELLGTFATRSPLRPNPIGVSTVRVLFVDAEAGKIGLAWIDALDETPVLDVKPYSPCLDRVENPGVPEWQAHWPKSVEASADFDWEPEFNFDVD